MTDPRRATDNKLRPSPGPSTSTDGEMTDPLTTSCGLSLSLPARSKVLRPLGPSESTVRAVAARESLDVVRNVYVLNDAAWTPAPISSRL